MKDLRGRLGKWEKNNAARSRLAFYGTLLFVALVIGLTILGLLNQKKADEPVPFLPNKEAPVQKN
ncbi:MAG: hypothetical protein IPN33_23550 [Saprospiraceae bacterium]|nr:hypothetical protein [Saprospiraceae bacterium]